MGYCTFYTIGLKKNEGAVTVRQFVDTLKASFEDEDYSSMFLNRLNEYTWAEDMDAVMPETTLEADEQCSWYEHTEDMIRMSKELPGCILTLYGEGEDSGDLWLEYYKDGLMQHEQAEIIYGDFDESKLGPMKQF